MLPKIIDIQDFWNRIGSEVTPSIRTLAERNRIKDFDLSVYLPSEKRNLQRRWAWNLTQQQEMVWSVIYKRPINPLCIVRQEKEGVDIWQVIDGRHRLMSLIQFFRNEFVITYKGKDYYFKDLPDDWRYEIGSFRFQTFMWDSSPSYPISDLQKMEWFARINWSGTPIEKHN